MFFSMEFGILSGLGVLLFARCFRHISYVSLSKYVCRGVCGFPLFSIMKPSKSCHGYCFTPQVHWGWCSG